MDACNVIGGGGGGGGKGGGVIETWGPSLGPSSPNAAVSVLTQAAVAHAHGSDGPRLCLAGQPKGRGRDVGKVDQLDSCLPPLGICQENT